MLDGGVFRNILPQPAPAGMLLTFAGLSLIELVRHAAAEGGVELGAAWTVTLVLAAALATATRRLRLAPVMARRMR